MRSSSLPEPAEQQPALVVKHSDPEGAPPLHVEMPEAGEHSSAGPGGRTCWCLMARTDFPG